MLLQYQFFCCKFNKKTREINVNIVSKSLGFMVAALFLFGIGTATANGEGAAKFQEYSDHQSLMQNQNAACLPVGTDNHCKSTSANAGFDLTQHLPGYPSSSADCQACINQYCDYECDGIGDQCASCIQQWCSWEC